jgi:circadian clock protein KaiB
MEIGYRRSVAMGGMERLTLRLYVSGGTARSRRAIATVRAMLEQLGDEDEVEVVDVLETPARAEEDRIVATPTLVKRTPSPAGRVIGDLSDARALMDALGLAPSAPGYDKETA